MPVVLPLLDADADPDGPGTVLAVTENDVIVAAGTGAVRIGMVVAAGALVTPRKTVPAGHLWSGRPARFMRELTAAERDDIVYQAGHDRKLARHYLEERAARA